MRDMNHKHIQFNQLLSYSTKPGSTKFFIQPLVYLHLHLVPKGRGNVTEVSSHTRHGHL